VKQIIIGLAVFLALILSSVKSISAKSYSIQRADFVVKISKSGDANVTENRTYNFSGSYSWADMWINTGNNYAISNIEIRDENGPLRFDESDSPDKVYIKWYYTALDQVKAFTLTYTIKNAVTDHPDIREFYWQLIGDQWTEGTGEVTARVLLPSAVDGTQIRGYGHGPLNGKVTIPDNQEVDFSAASLPSKKMFEVRVLFPLTGLPMARQSGQTLAQILDEEKGFADKTLADQRNLILLVLTEIILGGLVTIFVIFRVLYWTWKWWKEGRDLPPPTVNLAGTLHDPPSDLEPGMVETLLAPNLKPTGKAITATIINLIRKKAITLTSEKQTAALGIFSRKDKYFLAQNPDYDKSKMTDLETELMHFLFFLKKGGKVALDTVKKMGKTEPEKTRNFWKEWQKDCLANLAEDGYLELGNYKESFKIGRESGTFMVAGFVGLWFLAPNPILMAFSILVLAGGLVLSRLKIAIEMRTIKGNQEYANWKAFKKYIKEYSVTKNYPIDSVILWEKYMVYGAVLGVSIKALSQLPINYSAAYASSGLYSGYANSSSGTGGTDFANNFSHMFNGISAVSSGFSNFGATGTGSSGGFSGGGGGGGGGGGDRRGAGRRKNSAEGGDATSIRNANRKVHLSQRCLLARIFENSS
jgi:uncharacterized membrane protein